MMIRAILLCIATSSIARGARTVTNVHNVCTSTECLNIASELSKSMDPTIDPCEDFYEFACGGFPKSQPKYKNTRYSKILRSEIFTEIEQLIAANIEPNEPKAFKLVKKLYKSCMNTSAIEAKGLKPLRKYLRDLGGWPVVEGNTWKEKNFNRRGNIYKFSRTEKYREYHIRDALGYCVITHTKKNPSTAYIALNRPLGTLLSTRKHKNLREEQLFLRTYRDSLVYIAEKLGADDVRAKFEIDEMISFERKLAEIMLPKSKLAEPKKVNVISIAELNEKYPSVPWMTYIRKFMPSSINDSDEYFIGVPDPDYYVELEVLMANTRKRIEANYVMSRIALRYAKFSTEEMRRTADSVLPADFYTPSKERARYCAGEVMNQLWQGVAVMYADKFFSEETKDTAKAIVENVKWQVNMKLIEYNWPEEAAWNSTSDKIVEFATVVGYPDEVLDHSKLENLYGNLTFSEDDYFGNIVRLSNYYHELAIRELAVGSPEIDEWANLRGPIESNSVAKYRENSIYIGVAQLRGRYFGKDRPKFMNYGALGRIAGHEMVHAFFEPGLYRKGCEENVRYYGLGEKLEFDRRAQCLIEQYESYQVDNNGTKLDGKKTLSENLADLGGVRLAYDAYEGWAAVSPAEPKLPGLEQYSAKQMFWISAAATECEKNTPESIRDRIHTDKHTIGKFRIIGMLSNMPEFAEDFNCNAPSLMNPAKRCDIWQS